jgi:hypothetical protein
MDDLHRQIEVRAYEIWEQRCHSELWDYGRRGTAVGDYYQAEHEIIKEKAEIKNV